MDQTATSRAPIGAILAIVGGALLIVGSFLPWAEVSGGGQSVSAKGVDGSDGYLTIATGLVALVAGIMLLRQPKRVLAILVLVAGLLGGGLGLYDALTAKDNVLDAAAEELAPTFGGSAEQVRVLLDEAIDAGQLSISMSFGIFIVIAGGALALVGGFLSMRSSDESGAGSTSPETGFTSEPAAAPSEPTAATTAPPAVPEAPPASEPRGP
jgi:di/tricarboxylate transporter